MPLGRVWLLSLDPGLSLSPSLPLPVPESCQLYLGFPMESILSLALFDRRPQLWFNMAFGKFELFFFGQFFSIDYFMCNVFWSYLVLISLFSPLS